MPATEQRRSANLMSEKTENENWLAGQFVEAHNRLFGTDYIVEPATNEADSADAYLISKSEGSRISLQICLATTQNRMREESIQENLQRRISKSLMDRGLEDCCIQIVPGAIPTKKDLVPWHDCIVGLTIKHFDEATPIFELEHDGISETPFGSLPFLSFSIHRGLLRPEWKKWVIPNFVIAKDVLEVDTTIQGAIDKKIGKNYSDAKALWLLLQPGDGMHTIAQVELYESKLRGIGIFNQIWWVYSQRNCETEIYKFN